MPQEETPAPEASQPISESTTPTIEAHTPAMPPQETSPAPTEPEPVSSEPVLSAETPTAQIPPNEPIEPEPEPIQPPSAAAPVQTGILYVARDILAKASAKIQGKKKAKLEKIMQLLNTKNKITNAEVEKLLHVSDATATRYLSVLEKEGKIAQVGKTGHGVVYQKI